MSNLAKLRRDQKESIPPLEKKVTRLRDSLLTLPGP